MCLVKISFFFSTFYFVLGYCRSLAKSCLTLQTHGLQHTTLLCPSLSPRACSNSCPLSQWYRPAISSSGFPFSSCLQSLPASGSFGKKALERGKHVNEPDREQLNESLVILPSSWCFTQTHDVFPTLVNTLPLHDNHDASSSQLSVAWTSVSQALSTPIICISILFCIVKMQNQIQPICCGTWNPLS